MRTRRFAPSLRAQIIAVFGTLVIVVAGLLSYAFSELLTRRVEREAGSRLFTVANNAANLLADGLRDHSRQSEVLARAESIWAGGLDAHDALQMLERTRSIQPHHLWIGVADTAGLVRTATSSMLVGQSVRERPWFGGALNGVYVGDVHPAKLLEALLPPNASGEPLRFVDFAAPIRLHGKVVGVLGIHGSWEWAREKIEGLMPPDAFETDMALFIFDRAGVPIYAPLGQLEALRASGQRLPLVAIDNDGRSARQLEARVVRWRDGKDYLTTTVRMQPRSSATDLGWQVVAREPVELAFAEVRSVVRLAFGLGLAAAALAAALAWLAARRLSTDLYAVARAARRIEAGEAGVAIPVFDSSREVHDLGEAITGMTQRLLAANEQMDEKVRLRTAELQAANQALDLQARSDPLTGLLNRRGFDAQMRLALALARRSGRPLAVLTVDVDHFKRINDTHGHDVGDQVLQRLAQTLQQRLRDSDVVARFGGEEFVALLPDTDLRGAAVIAETLVHAMAAQDDPVAGRVTISAGVSALRDGSDQPADMLRRADEALYEAKGQGRNRVHVMA